jgi:hypothetical protein
MRKKSVILFVFIVSVALSYHVCAAELYGAKGAEQSPEPTLQQMLIYAIQDEYLAHAEYAFIINKYGSIRPFSNIIKAEETHINMLKPLFTQYGFPLPEDTAKDHIVVPMDIKAALETCVQGEIDNIAMYEKFLSTRLPDDVQEIFKRLKSASENHLRAFRNALSRY